MMIDTIKEIANAVSPLKDSVDNYKNVKKPNPSEFSMSEKVFLGKLALFGKEDLFLKKISDKFNITLPTLPNTTTANDKITALWLSQKEWLLVVNPSITNTEVDSLQNDLSSTHSLAIDVSDRWTTINISGNKAMDVLSKGTFIDLDNSVFGKGSCAQTTLWTVNSIIYKIDSKPSFDLFVDSTMATFLWEWLEHSSKEYIYD